MGQYYKPVNLDRKEWLYSHDYKETITKKDGTTYTIGNGLKLMEHSYQGNDFVAAVEGLLVEGQPWFKNRIVWAGDYADGNFITPEQIEAYKSFIKREYPDENIDKWTVNVFSLCIDNDENPEDKENVFIHKIFPPTLTQEQSNELRYIINHTKKEYVDKTNEPEIEDWKGTKINPLPLLTCDGNGRGGGDFKGSDTTYVGVWAGDEISMSKEKPDDSFKLIVPKFREM